MTAAQGAEEVLVGAFINLEAMARRLAGRGANVTLAAAGAEGRPVLDDVVCAGMLAQHIKEVLGSACALTDSASIAVTASTPYIGRIPEMLSESASGKALLSLGYREDLEFCSQLSTSAVVPKVVEGRVMG